MIRRPFPRHRCQGMLRVVQFEPETATLAELLRMQNDLSQVMQRRFGRMLALCFTDIVESVEYFHHFWLQRTS